MTRRRARWVAAGHGGRGGAAGRVQLGSGAVRRVHLRVPRGQTELSYPAGQRGSIGDLSGPDLTGEGTISLSDYPDTIIVLNVWGSWCGPCRGEVDSLNLAATLTADKGAQFLGINVKDTREAGADFHAPGRCRTRRSSTRRCGPCCPSAASRPAPSPSTIILDREHKVARIFLRVVTHR